MKALFPISLSNQRFSTKTVVPALVDVVGKYEEIYFVIADKLQLYNRALEDYASWQKAGHKRNHPPSLFSSERRLTGTTEERRRWLERVKASLAGTAQGVKWDVLTVDDIADRECFDVLRRVRTLFAVDERFRGDVSRSAREFASRVNGVKYTRIAHVAERISVNYILEETALSIRLRVANDIADEYYPGDPHLPIENVYRGVYLSSVWELSGREKTDTIFRFLQYHQSYE